MMLRLPTKLTLLTIILTLGSLGLAGQEVVVPSHPVKYHEVRLNLLHCLLLQSSLRSMNMRQRQTLVLVVL